jgi:PAS domain S-box-containing protein
MPGLAEVMGTLVTGSHIAFAVVAGLLGLAGGLAISARRRSERAEAEAQTAAEAADQQRAILESLQDGVLLFDHEERILFFNSAAVRILGVPRDHLEAGLRTWVPLDAEGDPLDPQARPVAITGETGVPSAGHPLGMRRADGTLRWLLVSCQPLGDAPGPNGRWPVVVAFTDITEQREAQAALERSNAELAEFAYVASHDLSEPLRMVSSYLQLLRRRYHGQIDEDADEFIDFAVDGASRMRALIEDLLAYSRAGRTAEPGPIDAELVVADVLSSLAPAIADAHAHVEVRSLPIVMGDRVALAQLFQNLVANALKFRDGPRARVWIGADRDGPAAWRISIADDGIGIDPRHRERVFKMFQRLHDSDEFEGTGIGLAICRKIVERHGGSIWMEAREGGGTVFLFTLPAVPAPALVRRDDEAPGRARATA